MKSFYSKKYKNIFLSLVIVLCNILVLKSQNDLYPLSIGNIWKYDGQSEYVLMIEKDTLINKQKVLKSVQKRASGSIIDYLLIKIDSVFRYNNSTNKFEFSWKQNVQTGDSIFYKEIRGVVKSVNANLQTPIGNYSGLVKVFQRDLSNGNTYTSYYKLGVGMIAYKNEDLEFIGYLVDYSIK